MGYYSKLQVIQRRNANRQYYLICPAPLAQALEMKKGEPLEWVIQDRGTIIIKRARTGQLPEQAVADGGARTGRAWWPRRRWEWI